MFKIFWNVKFLRRKCKLLLSYTIHGIFIIITNLKNLKNENNYEINFALTFAGKKLPLSKCTKCDVSFKLRGWAENFFYKNNAQGGK